MCTMVSCGWIGLGWCGCLYRRIGRLWGALRVECGRIHTRGPGPIITTPTLLAEPEEAAVPRDGAEAAEGKRMPQRRLLLDAVHAGTVACGVFLFFGGGGGLGRGSFVCFAVLERACVRPMHKSI